MYLDTFNAIIDDKNPSEAKKTEGLMA